MKPSLLIIDSSCLCYRSFFTTGTLSANGQNTGVIFGFLQQVLSLAKKFDTNRFAFCFDHTESYRKKIYPEYKANRKKDVEDGKDWVSLFKQIIMLGCDILPELGFVNLFCSHGYEGDDLIAYVIEQNAESGVFPTVIVSTDKDILQLVDYDHSIYNFKEIITREIFTERMGGLGPWFWAEAKAIGGCDSDNVIGVKGISDPGKSFNKDTGKYTSAAIKYLNKTASEKVIKKIEKESILIAKNRKLVHLPFRGKREPMCKINRGEVLKKKDFIDIFSEYEMLSFLRKEKFADWVKSFKLK